MEDVLGTLRQRLQRYLHCSVSSDYFCLRFLRDRPHCQSIFLHLFCLILTRGVSSWGQSGRRDGV